jgi:hypothetical protein
MLKIRRRKKPVSHVRPRNARPYNLASGFIYVGAVIASITLGAIFYKNIQEAKGRADENKAEPSASLAFPPGAKVITRSGQERIVTKPPSPLPHAKPAQKTETKEAPAPEVIAGEIEVAVRIPEEPPKPVEPELPNGEFPPLKPLEPTPWTTTYGDILTPQTVRLDPIAVTAVSVTPRKEPIFDLPLKGNEEFILTRYDISNVRGWTIKRATWHARVTRGRVRDLSFSTVLSDWNPATGRFLDLKGNSPVINTGEMSNQALPWNGWYFLRGHDPSIAYYAQPAETNNGPDQWISVELDPKIVQALVAGASYGIAICDEKGQTRQLAAIASTNDPESSPFIEIEGGLADVAPPGEITNLKAWAHPELSHPDQVGALLTWTATGDNGQQGQAFKYDIRYAADGSGFADAKALPRTATPCPQPAGQRDQVVIDQLQPNTDYTFFIRAVDEAGQPGPVSRVQLHTANTLKIPPTSAAQSFEASVIDIASRAAGLWIVDEATGVNPQTGQVTRKGYLETAPIGQPSFIWDRSSRTLNLRGTKNETIGFQLVFGRKGNSFPDLLISTEPFRKPPSEKDSPVDVRFYRVGYGVSEPIRGSRLIFSDALTPLKGPVKMPWPANSIPNQTHQSIYAELKVPADLPEGIYRSQLVITAPNGSKDSFNIILNVLPVTIPSPSGFSCELLIPPGVSAYYRKNILNNDEAAPLEQLYREMATEHRCTVAAIPYTSNGQCPVPFSPKIEGKGAEVRVTSWTEWDQRFGTALTQAATSYQTLPIFESWPTAFGDGYVCSDFDLRQAGSGFRVFGGNADILGECMSTAYWQAFRALVQQFGEHFKTAGWTGVPAGLWLVNQPSTNYAGRAPTWAFGHPLYRDDFLALDAFARAATEEASSLWPANVFTVRVTVPDAGALQGFGGSRFRLLSVKDASARGWEFLRERAAMYDSKLWLESDHLPLVHGPAAVENIGIGYFLEGADGWTIRETAGAAENWMRARDASLFYCGTPLGDAGPYPSLRLKMLRRTLQDIELLKLLQSQRGWTRSQLKDFVNGFMATRQGGVEQAENWYLLRQAVLDLLAKNPS